MDKFIFLLLTLSLVACSNANKKGKTSQNKVVLTAAGQLFPFLIITWPSKLIKTPQVSP